MQQKAKVFNTSGPCNPADHYMLDPLVRLDCLPELIDGENYFVIHAPRQTGKTTLLRDLAKKLTEEGHYAALHFSCEVASRNWNVTSTALVSSMAPWPYLIAVPMRYRRLSARLFQQQPKGYRVRLLRA